jgi:hypothetical protein
MLMLNLEIVILIYLFLFHEGSYIYIKVSVFILIIYARHYNYFLQLSYLFMGNQNYMDEKVIRKEQPLPIEEKDLQSVLHRSLVAIIF